MTVCIDCGKNFKIIRGNRKRCPVCISKKIDPNKSAPNVKCPRCEKIHYVKGACMRDRLYCDACKNLVGTMYLGVEM